jgi:hypothetical protein
MPVANRALVGFAMRRFQRFDERLESLRWHRLQR